MGHVRRMQHNRRHLIYKMIKEKELEKSNSRQHDELSEREGEISQANVMVYLQSPVGIGEHPDIMAAIEEELAKVQNIKKIRSTWRNIDGVKWLIVEQRGLVESI